jgi:16S rRNA (guanine527-N7)-methyltransferase
MPISQKGIEELLTASGELGLKISDKLSSFCWYYDFLLKENESVNLTALSREDDIVHKHFVDSLTCFLSGKLEGSLDVIDVGTGAGFPGIPLAIVRPELSLTLLDATRKKIEFVGRVCRGLGLSNAHAVWGRAEALGQQPAHRERYDRVVTRAVSSLSSLYELCLPLLKVGGYLITQKGPDADTEAAQAVYAGEKLGGRMVEVMPLRLPVSGDLRSLIIVEKVAPTPGNYPRRPGVPQKNPLS